MWHFIYVCGVCRNRFYTTRDTNILKLKKWDSNKTWPYGATNDFICISNHKYSEEKLGGYAKKTQPSQSFFFVCVCPGKYKKLFSRHGKKYFAGAQLYSFRTVNHYKYSTLKAKRKVVETHSGCGGHCVHLSLPQTQSGVIFFCVSGSHPITPTPAQRQKNQHNADCCLPSYWQALGLGVGRKHAVFWYCSFLNEKKHIFPLNKKKPCIFKPNPALPGKVSSEK